MNNESCILTVIKNEHEYLDEWIKYHLDLGIDHIFIFEDIDSYSHKEICDKYGDKVSLNSIKTVLNEEDFNKAKELKLTKKWNAQHLYFRNAIFHIKQTNKYNWCFVIDNDEFITLSDNNKSLRDVLHIYNNYDAFLMQWKCYGANGYVNKPDYSNKGLIETYTKEISGKVPDKLDSLVKTCYNLTVYDNSFFYNQHHPNNNCNWCNSNLERNMYTPVYNNIYIRHYITKSWEEYVWKRKTRGFMWGGARGLDTFFKINPDLNYKKHELMKSINVLNVTPFYLYRTNNGLNYSAQQVLENEDKIFLIESNKQVSINNIICVSEYCFDIKDNDFYAMMIIDKKSNDITLCYGAFSYCHSLYYYMSNDNLFVNISLHELLKKIKISPKFDIKSANEFVNNGFVRGESTLIEQIKKIPSLKTVIINKNNNIKTLDSVYYSREGLNNYVDNLKLHLPEKETKTILPLSGGFDSTLLSYLIRYHREKIALSVGSLDDVKSTELPNAKKTTAYLHIPHQEIHSDNRWIESLPKIVDIMEGEMFDIGVFLCYFLVNKIKELNITDYTLLTGDGADQLLNRNFYTENIDEGHLLYNRFNKFFMDKYPKHFFYYIIVKKIEWLLRLEGISYAAPFMSKEFSDFAKKTTFTEHKQEYKKFVKTYLPKEIGDTLVKRGGLVNERYIINEEIRNDFLDILHMPKYMTLFNTNCNPNELKKLLYKMYVVFFHYIFIEGNSIDMNLRAILNKIKFYQDMNETLIVLPYKQNFSQGNEIRLALNGWKKFCKFKYHFVIIGTFDQSLRNDFPWVEFIYCPQIDKKEKQYNPHLDVQYCMEMVMNKYSKIYSGFIWMVDDNYAIKPFDLDDIKRIHYHSSSFTGCEKCPTSFWRYDKWKTRQLLDKENLPHVNYTTHYPCYFEFNKLKEIWDRFNMRNESYVLEDIYFNYFKHEEPILDSEIRLGIWSKAIFDNEFQKAVENPNIKFMCNSVEGWSKELEIELEKIVEETV